MKTYEKYNLSLILWALICSIIVIYLFFNKPQVDDSVHALNRQIDSLIITNSKLDSAIYSERKKILKFETYIDSLEHLKPKIVTKYVNKFKEIDSASVSDVIFQFDSIFTKNAIK